MGTQQLYWSTAHYLQVCTSQLHGLGLEEHRENVDKEEIQTTDEGLSAFLAVTIN